MSISQFPRQGIDAWNAWRKENPDIRPDLRGASPMGTKLAGACFHEAERSGADFSNAILLAAKLDQALHMNRKET